MFHISGIKVFVLSSYESFIKFLFVTICETIVKILDDDNNNTKTFLKDYHICIYIYIYNLDILQYTKLYIP